MKKNKKLKLLIKKVIQDVFESGKLNDKKIKTYLESFKKLPTLQALEVLKEFERQLRRKLAETTITIESAVKLTPEEVRKVEKTMKSQHQINNLKLVVNESLLGGLKVRVGDEVYDDSVQTKIDEVGEAIAS